MRQDVQSPDFKSRAQSDAFDSNQFGLNKFKGSDHINLAGNQLESVRSDPNDLDDDILRSVEAFSSSSDESGGVTYLLDQSDI